MEGNIGKQNDEKAVSGESLRRSVARSTRPLRPAVFLDRDGTLIDDTGYLCDPEGVSFYPGIPEALKRLQENGFTIVVITNQSGIGRGYFDEETALAVSLSMVKMLMDRGVTITAVYFCPHHPDDRCSCRKPGLLMIQRALEDLGINQDLSWVVGDIDKDIWTGINAGLRPLLVETGKVEKGNVPGDVKRCGTVVEAVDHILSEAVK